MTLPEHLINGRAARRTSGSLPSGLPRLASKRNEAIFEGTDYPRTWDGFIGQVQAKEQLMVHIASAKARETRLEHILLASGQHGVGKTTLAKLLAYNAGVGIVETTGPLELEKAKRLILDMEDNDILFVDEIHSMVAKRKADAEWLLPFMTEGILYTDMGPVDCPKITIVGATTDAGRLPETILSRFVIKPKLTAYSEDEGALIATNLANRMQVVIEDGWAPKIARAASRNPRDMRSILTAIRDLYLGLGVVDFEKAIDWAGFSEDGLTVTAREILVVLASEPNCTASLDSLSALLSEPGPLRHHEKELRQRGLLTVGGRGRQLTEEGMIRAEVERMRLQS